MARNVPEKIKTKGGHQPRARIHASWSPIGQKMRRTATMRGLGAVLAVLLVIGPAWIEIRCDPAQHDAMQLDEHLGVQPQNVGGGD